MEGDLAQKIQALWRGYNLRKHIGKIKDEYQKIYLQIENSTPTEDILNFINIFERAYNIPIKINKLDNTNSPTNQIDDFQNNNIANLNENNLIIRQNLKEEICFSEQLESRDSDYLSINTKNIYDSPYKNTLESNISKNLINGDIINMNELVSNDISYEDISELTSSPKIKNEKNESNKLIPKPRNSLSPNIFNDMSNLGICNHVENENLPMIDKFNNKNIVILSDNNENSSYIDTKYKETNFNLCINPNHENITDYMYNQYHDYVSFNNLNDNSFHAETQINKSADNIMNSLISEETKSNQTFMSFTTVTSISDNEELHGIHRVINKEIDTNLNCNNSVSGNLINDKLNNIEEILENSLNINQPNEALSSRNKSGIFNNITKVSENLQLLSNNQLNTNKNLENYTKIIPATNEQLNDNMKNMKTDSIKENIVTFIHNNNAKDSSEKAHEIFLDGNDFNDANMIIKNDNGIIQNNEIDNELIKSHFINEKFDNKLLVNNKFIVIDENEISLKDKLIKNETLPINSDILVFKNGCLIKDQDNFIKDDIDNPLMQKEIADKRLQIVQDIVWLQRVIENRKKHLKESRK